MNTKAHLYLWLLLLLQSSIDCFKYDPSKYAIGLFEAYSPNGDGHSVPCMGTCYGTRKEVCRFGWGQEYEGKNCKITDNFLTRHYTEYYQGTTKQCISNCKHFGGYYKPWCITEDSWWMCIKETPRNVTRKTVFVSDNPTESGTRCVTPCGVWSENTYKCYDTGNKWVNCYPSPDGTKIVKSFHQYTKKRKQTFNEDGKLISCHTKLRKRRDSNDLDVDVQDIDTIQLESILAHNSVEEMAIRLEAIFTTETLPRPTSDDRSEDPILQYTVRIVPTPFDQPQIILPMVVRARYSNYTRPIARWSSTHDEESYRNRNPRVGLDDLGHIVQRALGGTDDPYNVVPQSRALIGCGPWGRLERIIRDYIKTHPTGTVDHIVVINYDFTRSYRPTSFAIRVRFYDAQRNLVNENGQPLNSFSGNIYEDIYVVNEDSPCGNDVFT